MKVPHPCYGESQIADLLGYTMSSVVRQGNAIVFTCVDGVVYKMAHRQECSESVTIEDIDGSLDDLVGVPLVQAEVSTNHDDGPENAFDSHTWTFYKLAGKGHVTIRWHGESNGFYSEEVEIWRVS